jgi:hypothetical protein
MSRPTVLGILAISFSMIVCLHSTCQAGILNGHAAAYSGVTGSVPFNNGLGLSGTIDYAVFTAAAFSANFGALGYVPNSALVYTYQVENSGSLHISAETIGVSNPASAIGTFNIGNVNASSASLTPNAQWLFAPGIAPGQSSWGLAFSSPNIPIVGASLTIDGGTPALVAGVPTPGPIAIPEPTSIALSAFGIVLACLPRRVCRRCAIF